MSRADYPAAVTSLRRSLAPLAAATLLCLSLAACGGDDTVASDDPTPSEAVTTESDLMTTEAANTTCGEYLAMTVEEQVAFVDREVQRKGNDADRAQWDALTPEQQAKAAAEGRAVCADQDPDTTFAEIVD